MARIYNCIDAGSEYCPCNLADSLDCISCSHLRGEDLCDCNWNGVCILYEYYMQNKQFKDFRKSYVGFLVDKTILEENLFLLKIQLNKELLKELNEIGSYIFIKSSESNHYFYTPMSIFNVDEDYAYVVYQQIGPKTKPIQQGEKLTIKGPYWNGIIGESKITNVKNSVILIIARGIGQSSILIPIKKLAEKNNKITLVLDKGKLKSLYCLDYVPNKNIKVEILDLFSVTGEDELSQIIKNNASDIIFSAGAEMLHRKVSSIINETENNAKFFVTNNNILCCGEGICGSCIRKTNSGERIRTCKTRINPKNMY